MARGEARVQPGAKAAIAFKLIESGRARQRTVDVSHLVAPVRAGARLRRADSLGDPTNQEMISKSRHTPITDELAGPPGHTRDSEANAEDRSADIDADIAAALIGNHLAMLTSPTWEMQRPESAHAIRGTPTPRTTRALGSSNGGPTGRRGRPEPGRPM
jgi:hypothetical protein